MNKVFISHSSIDRSLAEKLVDLLENMGVMSQNIFCSSVEGYGVPLGEDFLQRIKMELDESIMVLLLFSKNYYSSPICLCEMGAVWVKTILHVPVLVPPFSFRDIKGVATLTQGLIINDKKGLNSLYEKVKTQLNLDEININCWERKRDKFISELLTDIEKTDYELLEPANSSNYAQLEFDSVIRDVRDKLNKLPWIVRKGLYYHFADKEFTLDPDDEDMNSYAMEASLDDYLLIDGKWITLNFRDPKLRKAVEAIISLGKFLDHTNKVFHSNFEYKYEMCAKIESRKFWRLMELM